MPRRSRPGARTPRVTLSACLFLLGAGAAFAQVSKNPAPPTEPIPPSLVREADGRVIVRATRVTEPIRLDGRLDESVYSRIPPITDFIQQEPIEGAPVTERTEAWILFDDKNIYIVCRCWQANPELIVANDMRRDGPNINEHDSMADDIAVVTAVFGHVAVFAAPTAENKVVIATGSAMPPDDELRARIGALDARFGGALSFGTVLENRE